MVPRPGCPTSARRCANCSRHRHRPGLRSTVTWSKPVAVSCCASAVATRALCCVSCCCAIPWFNSSWTVCDRCPDGWGVLSIWHRPAHALIAERPRSSSSIPRLRRAGFREAASWTGTASRLRRSGRPPSSSTRASCATLVCWRLTHWAVARRGTMTRVVISGDCRRPEVHEHGPHGSPLRGLPGDDPCADPLKPRPGLVYPAPRADDVTARHDGPCA